MIWQKHSSLLNEVDVVGVVAEDSGQGGLPQLGQLLHGEAARPTTVLIPESISTSDVVELPAYDAGKGGAQQSLRQRNLADPRSEQLHVLRCFIDLAVRLNGSIVHYSMQI